MCKEKPRPNVKDILANLTGPMPLGRKLGQVVKNNLYKIRNRTNCCGHPGEPGC